MNERSRDRFTLRRRVLERREVGLRGDAAGDARDTAQPPTWRLALERTHLELELVAGRTGRRKRARSSARTVKFAPGPTPPADACASSAPAWTNASRAELPA